MHTTTILTYISHVHFFPNPSSSKPNTLINHLYPLITNTNLSTHCIVSHPLVSPLTHSILHYHNTTTHPCLCPTPLPSHIRVPTHHFAYCHITILTHPQSRTGIESFRHNQTTRLRQSINLVINPTEYFLDQDFLIFALETIHSLSPHSDNRHYIPTAFTQAP